MASFAAVPVTYQLRRKAFRENNILVRVCLHVAWIVSPALTLIISGEAVVGFGPPLQATALVVTSVIGCASVSLYHFKEGGKVFTHSVICRISDGIS